MAHRNAETVIAFGSSAAADAYAPEKKWSDYEVTPLRFFVKDPSRHWRGGQLDLDAALSRVRRAGPSDALPT